MTKKIKKLTQVILHKKSLPISKKFENLISAKAGYARNYLLPKQLAKLATILRIQEFEQKSKNLSLQELQIIEIAKEKKIILEKIKQFTIRKKVINNKNNNKKIFGSLRNKDIIDLICQESKLELENLKIIPFNDTPIKELGIYNIRLLVYPNIFAKIELNVIAK